MARTLDEIDALVTTMLADIAQLQNQRQRLRDDVNALQAQVDTNAQSTVKDLRRLKREVRGKIVPPPQSDQPQRPGRNPLVERVLVRGKLVARLKAR
jgi:hypothetical protein